MRTSMAFITSIICATLQFPGAQCQVPTSAAGQPNDITPTQTDAPAAGQTAAPPAGQTAAPAAGQTAAPAAGQTDAPPAGQTAAPAAGQTDAPPAGQTAAPAAGQTDAPSAEQATALNAQLNLLIADYDSPSPSVRTNARCSLAKLIVGDWPSRLENRLGDYSEEELTSKGAAILTSHQQFVADLQTFAGASAADKAKRKSLLQELAKRTSVLSAKDNEDVQRQLDELTWTDDSIRARTASALVMLAFNYHYFHGLDDRIVIVKTLRDAMQLWPKVVMDQVFLDVAKKGLAQTDPMFMTEFKTAAGTDFDPVKVP